MPQLSTATCHVLCQFESFDTVGKPWIDFHRPEVATEVEHAINAEQAEFVAKWKNRFRNKIQGLPGNFDNPTLIGLLIEWAVEDGFLVAANDEHLLEALREIQKNEPGN